MMDALACIKCRTNFISDGCLLESGHGKRVNYMYSYVAILGSPSMENGMTTRYMQKRVINYILPALELILAYI